MRSFVERNVAKTMTCKSSMASAVREACIGDDANKKGRAMGIIQSAIVAYFETYHITRFMRCLLCGQQTAVSVMYAMTTGNWSTQTSHSSGNMVAQAVAVKTGIIHLGRLGVSPSHRFNRSLP